MQRIKGYIKKILYEIDPRYRPFRALRNRYRADLARIERKARRGEVSAQAVREFKRNAFMHMPAIGGELALVQEGNFLLLKALKSVCEKHGIGYWILGGTLLGAVRHRGFIPWDDDVDVGMLREDYLKLREALADEPALRLAEYCNNRDHNGRKIFAQVVKLTPADDESPFWVDILLYDYAGQGETSPDELWKSISAVRRGTEQQLIAMAGELKKTYWDEIVTDTEDRRKIDEAYAQGMEALPAVEEKSYIYRGIDSFCGAWQRLFPCERMMPFVSLEFEGELFPAPKDHEWYLELNFGDYLVLPEDIGRLHIAFLGERLANAKQSLERLKKITVGDGTNDRR